ncbi:MAG: lipopolysaccharide assembly protein LapA domain-containing protein [Leptolyngbyaceae bacterium]|nr:lipopolysaccharide assembly protein LapA domain-containing protein [Leptolyngbyaceae bacterium]
MPIFLIFALVIAFLAIIFAIQNNIPIVISFLVWQSEGSLALVLLVTLAVGAIIGLLVSVPTIVKRGMRTARERRKVEELETMFRSKEDDVSTQTRRLNALTNSYQDLLEAFELLDPRIRVVPFDALSKALDYVLKQMQIQTGNTHYESVAVFLVSMEPATPTDSTVLRTKNNALMRAIAQRLHSQGPIDQWLFGDGYGQFACTVLGLDQRRASDYGERLRDALIQEPLQLDDQSQASVKANIGGAIAYRQSQTNHQHLIATAQQALEQAQNRGQNRFRLLQATP